MGHCGTAGDRVSVHLPDTSCTLMADRGLAGMPMASLHVSRLALSVARLCGTYLSALLQRQTGKVMEAF